MLCTLYTGLKQSCLQTARRLTGNITGNLQLVPIYFISQVKHINGYDDIDICFIMRCNYAETWTYTGVRARCCPNTPYHSFDTS